MSDLTQTIREVARCYDLSDGFLDFDLLTDEDKADLIAHYVTEKLGSNAYETLEVLDPRDFSPHMKFSRSGIDHTEIGRMVVKAMTDYCQSSIQELIDEELREVA
jgi:hypothetical protein